MRNEPWVWPEVRDAGTSGAGAVPLRSAQLMGQPKKKKSSIKKRIIVRRSVRSMLGRTNIRPVKNGLYACR